MFGILAEDQTDVATMKVLIRRMMPANRPPPAFGAWAANGCANLRLKAAARFRLLVRDGCDRLILVHDLDRNPNNNQLNNEALLRTNLEGVPVPAGAMRLICIPVEEIEAWFFSDPGVLDRYGARTQAVTSPHLVARPKERLRDLSRAKNKKPRYSTNDNPNLASVLDLALCADRCAAFRQLRDFVLG